MVRVFDNSLENQGSIPGQVIPDTKKKKKKKKEKEKEKKKVLYASLLNTQHCKIQSKSKWSNSGKGVVAIQNGAFGSPNLKKK